MEMPAADNPFQPDLKNSTPLAVTPEQDYYVRELLSIVCSDSQFQVKAYNGLKYILTQVVPAPPVVTSLNPSTAVLGSPNFTLHVIGTGFDPEAKIIWNGGTEITTYVSETELTTEVNMETAGVALDLPVAVQSGTGVMSNSMTFSLTAPVLLAAATAPKPGAKSGLIEVREEEKKRLFDRPKVDNKLPEEPMKQHKEDKSKG